MNLNQFLDKFNNVKSLSNDEYQASCPAHNDKISSLSIKLDYKTGKILMKCHAGCDNKDILKAIGLKEKDLFEPKKDSIVSIYEYIDLNGKPYEVVRYFPKTFKQRQPDGKGGYIWNLHGIETSLYRIKEIDKSKQIFIVEGEKDCDNLWSKGIQATTNAGGANKWKNSYSDLLIDCEVFIIPDNDNPGRIHAKEIAESLQMKAKSIKLLELPDLPEKGDISDYLLENKACNLLKLASECEEWQEEKETLIWLPELVLEEIGKPEKKLLFQTGFKTLDSIIEFKEERFIVISGLPGFGKTSFCYNLLLKAAEENICLFENLEMDREETYSRLTAILKDIPIWQVKLNKNFNLKDWKTNFEPLLYLNNIAMDFDQNYTMESIDRICQKISPKVLFIDNNKLLDTEVETDSDIRHYELIAKQCKQLAKKRKICVILIAHTRKDTIEKEPTLSDIYGASAFGQLADAVMFLHPKNKDTKHILTLKIAKNRQGRIESIPMIYIEEKTKFMEVIECLKI